MRTLPLGPSVEPHTGPRHVRGVCRNERVEDAMRPLPLKPLVEPPRWGHEACEGCVEMGGGTLREPCRWSLR